MDANSLINAWSARLAVSIHAPVMDAKSTNNCVYGYYGFNPRARDGREGANAAAKASFWFQSTRP